LDQARKDGCIDSVGSNETRSPYCTLLIRAINVDSFSTTVFIEVMDYLPLLNFTLPRN